MGGDPDFGHLDAASVVQLAEASRDLVLQHGSNTAGVVEYLADPRRALQPGRSTPLSSKYGMLRLGLGVLS